MQQTMHTLASAKSFHASTVQSFGVVTEVTFENPKRPSSRITDLQEVHGMKCIPLDLHADSHMLLLRRSSEEM